MERLSFGESEPHVESIAIRSSAAFLVRQKKRFGQAGCRLTAKSARSLTGSSPVLRMAGERIDRRSMVSFVFRPVASTGAFRDVTCGMRPHMRGVVLSPHRRFGDACRESTRSGSRKASRFRYAVVITLAAVWFGSVCPVGRAADRIVLRDLTVIADHAVREFNLDGVVLDDGKRLRWDEIESGKLAANQAEFDQLLREIGGPLYRVRQRLKVGDYRGASEPVEELYPRFVDRVSESAFLVLHTTVWSRMSAGRRGTTFQKMSTCSSSPGGIAPSRPPPPTLRRHPSSWSPSSAGYSTIPAASPWLPTPSSG